MKMLRNFEQRLMILFSNGKMIYKCPSQLRNMTRKNIRKEDQSIIFNLKDINLVKFEVLRSQDRLLLFNYNKKLKSSKFFDYNQCFIVDPTGMIEDKAPISAVGSLGDNNVACDYDGSNVFSIKLDKKGWKVQLTKVYFKENYKFKVHSKKNCTIVLTEISESKELPAAMWFAEKTESLIVSHRNGQILIYKVDNLLKESAVRDANLTSESFTDYLIQNEDFKMDFGEDLLMSWDEKYLICRCKSSRLFIFKLENFQLNFVKEIITYDPIYNIGLSFDGRFLVTSGMFFESIMRVDLSKVDVNSFGENCFNLIKLFEERADDEGKEESENYQKLDDKIKCYKFGNLQTFGDIRNKDLMKYRVAYYQSKNINQKITNEQKKKKILK